MSNTQTAMTQEQLEELGITLGRATVETIQTMLTEYAITALWASPDEYCNPLDEEYTTDDIDPETMAVMRADCFSFLSACWGDTWEFSIDISSIAPEQLGHDFWLTRNRHGAGFWDRGLGEIGEQLTVLAHSFGEFELIADGDKVVHV